MEKHLAAKSENTGSGLVYAEFVIPDIFDFSTSFLIFFLVLSYFHTWPTKLLGMFRELGLRKLYGLVCLNGPQLNAFAICVIVFQVSRPSGRVSPLNRA